MISATFQETIEFSCVLWKSFERSTLGSETVPVSDSCPWRAAGVSGGFPCAALELRGWVWKYRHCLDVSVREKIFLNIFPTSPPTWKVSYVHEGPYWDTLVPFMLSPPLRKMLMFSLEFSRNPVLMLISGGSLTAFEPWSQQDNLLFTLGWIKREPRYLFLLFLCEIGTHYYTQHVDSSCLASVVQWCRFNRKIIPVMVISQCLSGAAGEEQLCLSIDGVLSWPSCQGLELLLWKYQKKKKWEGRELQCDEVQVIWVCLRVKLNF